MKAFLQIVRSNPTAVTFLLLALLAVVPLVYDLPLLRLGLDDENMLRHFDDDEWGLYQAWVEPYTRGPLYASDFDMFLTYPKFYYNTAGVILYPYSILNGESVSVVVTTLRTFNMVFGIGTIFVLYFLVKRVFRSNWMAVTASGLFALTPQFLVWTTNSRPNPLEWMLIFAALFFTVRLCERFSFKLFLLATFAGALAFATKFGSTPILILIPVTSIYLIWRQERNQSRFSEIVGEQMRVYRYLLPALAAFMGAGAVFLLWALNSNDWSGVSLAYGWSEGAFQPEKAARLLEVLEGQQSLVNGAIWGVVAGLATGAILSMIIQRRIRVWASTKAIQPGVSIYVTLFAGFVIVTGVIYVVVFFATGPAFIAHPQHFFSAMGFQFRYQVLGLSYGELGKPGLVEFIKDVGSQFHAGWLAFVPLIGYAAYINIRGSNSSSVQRDQRLVLWGFILITMVLFFGSQSATSLRHILPVVGILYLFMAEVIVLKFRRWQHSRAAVGMALALAMLMLLGFGAHAREAYGNWDYLRFKPNDTGVQVGNWLQERYPEDTRLMTDYIRFYVPPSFTEVANTTTAEWDRFRGPDVNQAVIDWIVSFDPEVLVLSHPQQYEDFVNVFQLLESDETLKSLNYRLVKEFEYQRPDRQRYEYKRILVYEKGEFAVGTSLDSGLPGRR